ncbi:VanZ family protein [Clostridium sp. BL-8]|uniref:VanZ family protein n=1 Tax=Clostridium sp. BL-8 TaxID=349938 RepID=UPI00098C0705|nr:VanZ family protein [Clostridium sp. BL-8]OOM80338.1 VanZ like family protein [Clostridium sp. BL-8]
MKKITIILCLFWMGFIFYMSSNNGQVSHGESIKVVKIIENAKSKIETETQDKNTSEIKADKSTNNDQKANGGTETGSVVQANKNTTNLQSAKLGELDHIVRKNAHGFLYMTLAVFVSSAIFSFNKKGKGAVIYILFTCLFYAVTDEFHQSFVPGRTSMVSDILVDFSGAIIGLLIFYFVYYKIYTIYASKKLRT